MNKLESPKLGWKENKTPVSERFDDVYFSVDDGVAESLYVFINGCGMPEAFEGKESFTVAETGFGTGLNFLLTWQCWKESGTQCQLNYLSVEAFPLSVNELREAYKNFPSLKGYGDEFLKFYPVLTPGFHHIVLEGGKVKLTLMLGDAAQMYQQATGQVDAWYLDGFAPAKNPEMWCQDVFDQMGRLSAPGAIVSTFTAAGFVKRGLQEAGFEMTKRKGFGRKRESLIGTLKVISQSIENKWFIKYLKPKIKKKVAVVGGGVAGCVTARRLMADGHEVHLFDRNKTAGQEGSGNRLGLIQPRITMEGGFNLRAYLHALSFYDHLGDDIWKGGRGIFQMAEDEEDLQRQKLLCKKLILPASEMTFLERDEASEKIGIEAQNAGLWFANAGCLEPEKLCKKISENIPSSFDVNIDHISQADGRWIVKSGGGIVFEGDAVVLATAGENSALNDFCTLPMGGRRGQVSYVQATDKTSKLRHAITGGGYMIPAYEREHIVGATFERWSDFFDYGYKEVSEEGHVRNREKLNTFMPDIEPEIRDGRSSIRAMTSDHLPIVGPVFSQDWYVEAYEALKHGPRGGDFVDAQYVEGLYVMCGLGARGVQTAPLLADILSSYIDGTACPIENTYREALHPARFLIRDIRKGRL
ncbi:bifunctional tRNA (5-methylaminomethyl-2-thiouridine)(34)-methyltransferase MnmD/FAD-dependent 5-carboxymethylaminomethyl-2-thiouridine(34) oxidoreductase MnmC [Terasakiella sp. SH-1]|uniref:bifunctional tRNA (5-methylaminomethyl-2-thiouridine)(34)-methyltransferase MnmD/FAD-dependent 5-carboxymethylaminomethyl-2-thiouridine(34) oxidoreductase MnmC n=1 Tax=Terasakiella sp. SH-1 TaxID=2560057 RepID=UPI0010746E10|nr:bifunctional tRNA (5-methylaminomethyl-2-thiouridine)(34)-methyltransferase MnmD/FAD-dependent 5-carboxymethylaminomethyl-2-thiouridine(34) oxidoreductase MnmC [Terasakiella sp. SH-1]